MALWPCAPVAQADSEALRAVYDDLEAASIDSTSFHESFSAELRLQCAEPQGHRATGNPRKPRIFRYFSEFLGFLIKYYVFFVEKKYFSSFFSKSHAESFIDFVKNPMLNPKHARFNQKS